MSIEGSRHIDPFTKAKLQENGILTEDQLRHLLANVNRSHRCNEESTWTDDEERTKSMIKALQRCIPTLTDKEAVVLFCIKWSHGNEQCTSSTALASCCSSRLCKEGSLMPYSVAHSAHLVAPQDDLFSELPFQIRTLAQLQKEHGNRRRRGHDISASTFSRSLDQLLGGGGARLGEVLEISGPPGVGKTQLLMQFAVSCTLPVMMGGLGGSCLYVDTEGSFVPERFYQVVAAAVAIVNSVSHRETALLNNPFKEERTTSSSRSKGDELHQGRKKRERSGSSSEGPQRNGRFVFGGPSPSSMAHFTVEYVMKRVHYCRVVSATKLLAILHCLPDIVTGKSSFAGVEDAVNSVGKNDAVKMVLVDSVAMPFRALESFTEQRDEAQDSTGDGWYDSLLARSIEDQRRAAASRRARLIFMLSQLLYSHATELNLAVVVSNHVISRPLRGWLAFHGCPRESNEQYDSDSYSKASSEAVLLPALGDSWGFGLSSRVLLSFHHHFYVPFCVLSKGQSVNGTSKPRCGSPADILCSTLCSNNDRGSSGGDTSSWGSSALSQHRVARIIKGSPCCSQEACFAITRKGIRDWKN